MGNKLSANLTADLLVMRVFVFLWHYHECEPVVMVAVVVVVVAADDRANRTCDAINVVQEVISVVIAMRLEAEERMATDIGLVHKNVAVIDRILILDRDRLVLVLFAKIVVLVLLVKRHIHLVTNLAIVEPATILVRHACNVKLVYRKEFHTICLLLFFFVYH